MFFAKIVKLLCLLTGLDTAKHSQGNYLSPIARVSVSSAASQCYLGGSNGLAPNDRLRPPGPMATDVVKLGRMSSGAAPRLLQAGASLDCEV